jgi:hypothetical protein
VVADPDAGSLVDEACHVLVVDLPLHEDPRARLADLAAVEEGAEQTAVHGQVHLGASQMMFADFPPSSSVTFLMVSEPIF